MEKGNSESGRRNITPPPSEVIHKFMLIHILDMFFFTTGLDTGDRQILEKQYAGCEPPPLLDSSDGRYGLSCPILLILHRSMDNLVIFKN